MPTSPSQRAELLANELAARLAAARTKFSTTADQTSPLDAMRSKHMGAFATWAPQGYAVKGTATATTVAAATEVAAGRASSSVLRQPHRSASTATRVPPPPSPRPSPRMEGRRGWAARSSTATADEGVGGQRGCPPCCCCRVGGWRPPQRMAGIVGVSLTRPPRPQNCLRGDCQPPSLLPHTHTTPKHINAAQKPPPFRPAPTPQP
eukprot:COSAG01_NODE_23825_length_800_cov_1.500713_1_plen_205_part_10